MKKTVLLDKHIKLGAKIVDFAGFKMPISYSSVTDEHNHVRENVGVFDVSHMGEFEISGKNSAQFVQFICSNDIIKLKPGKAQYNCLVNDNGGIIDDLIVYKIDEEKYLLVVNASNIEKDLSWIKSQNESYNCYTNFSSSFWRYAKCYVSISKEFFKNTSNICFTRSSYTRFSSHKKL